MMKKRFLSIFAVGTALLCAVFASACGNGSANEDTPLTENTDFSALTGEKVTEQEWRAAFSPSLYSNVTVRSERKVSGYEPVLLWKRAGNTAALFGGETLKDTSVLNELYRETEDSVLTVVYDYGSETGGYIGTETDKTSLDYDSDAAETLEWYMNYTMACPDFSEFYSFFEYNEREKAYVFDREAVTTNSTFEWGDTTYHFASVKIVGGKLAFVNMGNYFENEVQNDTDVSFYDFGTTSIAVPEYSKKEF